MQRFPPPSSDKNRLILDVTLKGGPPWGFNLTGGSEFGAALSIKKVNVFGFIILKLLVFVKMALSS